MIALIFIIGCAALLAGYRIYGRLLERMFDVDPSRPTPAHTMTDGVDYVPAKVPVLFGHHFSSIAGAVPIVGPIVAASAFGWLPPLLWIVLGAIFVGGVHDFSALIASIRHKARSIAEIVGLYLSPTTHRIFLCFIWVALVYVLVVFVDLTATTFAPPVAKIADAAQKATVIRDGGIVASTSVVYIFLALAFGLLVNTNRISLRAGSFIFVPLVFITLLGAEYFPLSQTMIPKLIQGDPKNTWSLVLIGYCFLASVMPVWMLLQPRDYLSSFLLFACIVGGGLGLVVTGLTGQASVQFPAFITYNDTATAPPLGFIFPALFITVACGAVSGFHSIVASGTTAKQLPSEGAARPVGYGAMLVEAVLALIALGAIMMVVHPGATPQATFAAGMGKFLSVFGVKFGLGVTFALLAISTFLLTTLDTCTRLARYVLEELTGLRGGVARYVSTTLTLVFPLIIVFIRLPDPSTPGAFLPAWRAVYPVFGATNQLLAAFALLSVMVWRVHQRRSYAFVALPMLLMLSITITQLVIIVATGFGKHQVLVTTLAAILLAIAIALLGDTIRSWGRVTKPRSDDDETREPVGATKS